MNLSVRQKELATAAFIALVFGGSLLAAEAALRLQQVLAFGTVESVEKSDLFIVDPQTGLRRPVPGSRHGKIVYNRQGYRSPDLAPQKPAGTLRIAFLGSSTTNDAYVPELESTWPHVTTEVLRRRFPQCRFEYLNAGVPGLNSRWMSLYYRDYVVKTRPDLVIVLTDDQSDALKTLARKAGLMGEKHFEPSWLSGISLVWEKLEKNAQIVKLQRAATTERGKLVVDSAALAVQVEPSVAKLLRRIRRSGAKPVLLGVEGKLRPEQSVAEQIAAADTALFFRPFMSLQGFHRARFVYNQSLARVAANEGARYLDPSGKIPGDAKHFVDTAHFTAAGSARMGEFLGNALAERAVVSDSAGCRIAGTTSR